MKKSDQTAEAAKCARCTSELNHDAKYCHICGARAGGRTQAHLPVLKYVALVVVLGAVSAGLFLAFFGSDTEFELPATTPQLDNSGFTQLLNRPPDLSTMTAREAADRLFNRVMAASENSNNVEALQFAPMALAAYQRVKVLDADAHYHVGLINLVLGDLAGVGEQIELLLRNSPNHLLGLALAYEVEKRQGSGASASEFLTKFSDAYDVEIGLDKVEYEVHGVTLKKLHDLATRFKRSTKPSAALGEAEGGKRLFKANCVQCHGLNASGTDIGPPLVHRYYEPDHHSDAAFHKAVARGVKSHHWNFGNMPPIAGLTEEEVAQIISYVRDLQEENGIK